MGDDGIRRVQDRLRGAVILLKLHHPGVRPGLFKGQDILKIRAPKAIDALVVIPHHTDVSIPLREEMDELELNIIGILVFVHQDIAESLLIKGEDLGILSEELHRFQKKIIKVKRIIPAKTLLIGCIAVRNPFPAKVSSLLLLEILRGDSRIFRGGDSGEHRPLPKALRIDLELLEELTHHRALVLRVIDGKVRSIADGLDPPPQDSDTHTVKG